MNQNAAAPEPKRIPVADHLSPGEYKLLLKVYANHNRSMGLEARKDFTLSHITKVKRNQKERCLEVYYKNGEWFHYATDGTWY